MFKPILEHENTYKELNRFFDIVESLFNIMNNIRNDKFGRLINNSSRIALTWEAYMWFLLPIMYIKKELDTNTLKLMTKWYFRNMGFKNRSFNNLCYSNEFIRISNKMFINDEYDYYEDLVECLNKNKDVNINEDNYTRNIKENSFNSVQSSYLLLFLETCINTDIHNVPLDYTLEHIYCQKDKSNLLDKSLINNLGNLTLIEGKNSNNGHKGNSSLGAKKYEVKVQHYKESNCKITRELAKKYSIFGETDIKSRQEELIKLLNIHTNY